MRQVPAEVWRQIPFLVGRYLRTTHTRRMFVMTQPQLDAALESQLIRLTVQGYPEKVVTAFQAAAPLLLEAPAIAAFVERVPTLRKELAPVWTLDEALLLGQRLGLVIPAHVQQMRELMGKAIAAEGLTVVLINSARATA
jgi:hypothetical protein